MSAHAFKLSELTAHALYTIPFLLHTMTEYDRKRVFFIAPSFGSFSLAGKSFCILQYLASLSFANPLSIHVMLFLHFSPPQYIAIIFLLLSIARKFSFFSEHIQS